MSPGLAPLLKRLLKHVLILKQFQILFIVAILITPSLQMTTPTIQPQIDPSKFIEEIGAIKHIMQTISNQLEKFNTLYLGNLEQKMTTIMTTMTHVDSNIKALHERSQVWEIFRHHIDSWTDHIKSVDHKLDLMKRKQDEFIPVEDKLNHLDFKVQHIFDKLDLVNEKMNEKLSNEKKRKVDHVPDILHKLKSIDHHVNMIQSHNCKVQPKFHFRSNKSNNFDLIALKMSLDKINLSIDRFSSRDLRQIIGSSKRNFRLMEGLEDLVREIDERTVRMYDSEDDKHKKLLTCCENTGHEIITFTASADLLLKKIENLVLNLDGTKFNITEEVKTNYTHEEDQEEFGSGSDNLLDLGDEEELYQPTKSACHEIKKRKSGVYVFGESRDLNKKQRDFNERLCEFATEGPAWTVIQKRGSSDQQLNFNKSWSDYKNGFGDWEEFWLGNEFIHRLTFEENMMLRVELEDYGGNSGFAEYGEFSVGTEKNNYFLNVGDYLKGTVTDSIISQNKRNFQTFDRRNSTCGTNSDSGWWYKR